MWSIQHDLSTEDNTVCRGFHDMRLALRRENNCVQAEPRFDYVKLSQLAVHNGNSQNPFIRQKVSLPDRRERGVLNYSSVGQNISSLVSVVARQ